MPVIKHQVRKNLVRKNLRDGTHALTVHLPNPANPDNQPKMPCTSTGQLKIARMIVHMIAQMIVNLASRHGARQMMTALRPFAEKHGGKNTLVKAPNQILAKMRQRRPKPCSANAQNLPVGPVLVMPPQRNGLPKTNKPAPPVTANSLAKSKPLAIILASQQNRAAMGPVRRLVMPEMAAIGRKNRAKRAAAVQVLGVQVPGHPDQEGHHGLDRGGTAA
jgi:hypothetical protein